MPAVIAVPPNLPDWVEAIDERGYTPNLKEQK